MYNGPGTTLCRESRNEARSLDGTILGILMTIMVEERR